MVYVETPDEFENEDAVRQALAGRIDQLSPSAALAMLPATTSGDAERRRRLLHEALVDRDLPPEVRALAVVSLSDLPSDDAIDEASAVLDQPDVEEPVAARAVALLGRLGNRDHLDRLAAVLESATTDVLQQRAAFARTLIVHRFGLEDVAVDVLAPNVQPRPEGPGTLMFVSRPLGHPRRLHAIEAATHAFPWMETVDLAAYELQCGHRLMAVVVRREITSPRGLAELTERPSLAAVATTLNDETGRYFPSFVALTRPGERGGVRLHVARLAGEPVYIGSGSVDRSRLDIDLLSADTPGVAPVDARIGTVRGRLEIAGVSARAAAAGQMPEPETS